MGKKAKKKKLHPPLSFLDKCIYLTVFIVFLMIILSIVIISGIIKDKFVFNDPSVVAYRNHASNLLSIPFLFYFFISFMTFLITAYESKKPIFGNKKVHYGIPPWEIDFYPLFDKRRKTAYTRPSKKRFRKKMLTIWCIGLILTSCLVPFSFFGRDCLYQDNSIASFNALNIRSNKIYTESDYSKLEIKAVYVPQKNSGYWSYQINIITSDNKRNIFSNHDFDGQKEGSKDITLDKMLEIKSLFPSSAITVSGKEDLEKVIEYCKLSDFQSQKLYMLFEN